MAAPEGRFEFRGVNHLALVCRDMARTVDFYTNVLGMPLVKTIELPAGMGQHFFFDCGGGDTLAFFWFPDAPEPAPGVSAPGRPARPGSADQRHRFDEPRGLLRPAGADRGVPRRLLDAGVDCTEVANHDDSEWGIADEPHPGVFVRSVYFQDPDGILLELACWTRQLTAADVSHQPARAVDPARA